jgi:hypothetical protein
VNLSQWNGGARSRLNPPRLPKRFSSMSECRILYFRGGILEDTVEIGSGDLVKAAKAASSNYPELTAEIWLDGRKAAVIRPSWRHLPHPSARGMRFAVAPKPQRPRKS